MEQQGPTLYADHHRKKEKEQEDLIRRLYEQVGKLQIQVDWLKKRWALSTTNKTIREIVLSHIDKQNKDISIATQASLLGISRASVYYQSASGVSISIEECCHQLSQSYLGTDITYIRMKQGFLYLVAFLDRYSRYVVSWRLSTMLTTDFVLHAAYDALTIGIQRLSTVQLMID